MAWAEVGPDSRLVENTGFTLQRRETKVGLVISGYGITDRLEINAAMFPMLLTYFNLGLKYGVFRSEHAALAVEAYGGYLLAGPLLDAHLYHFGAQASFSAVLRPNLLWHNAVGWRAWNVALSALNQSLLSGRIALYSLRSELEWDVTRRHILFFTLETPTVWNAALLQGAHAFDATDFWAALVGYQYSAKVFNVRLNLGYGPSFFGRGPTGSLDLYARF